MGAVVILGLVIPALTVGTLALAATLSDGGAEMAALALPAGYRIARTRTGYAAQSPYGLIGDAFDCEAEAIFAAQDHADALAQEEADLAAAEDAASDHIALPRAA
ncbi:hypothetical protein ACRAWG_31345 [Methylobacterium sp. P31]